jgi:hypothetical protein
MKNIKIKNFHIPTFLIETLQLEQEINLLGLLTDNVNHKMEKLKEQSQMLDVINEAIKQFKIIVPKAYPKEANMPAVKFLLSDLPIQNFDSLFEFKEQLAEILFRIFFSEGEDKIFDPADIDFVDYEKYLSLMAQEIQMPEEWADQLLICLNAKNANEDMLLHNLTPEWMWPKTFRLLIALYELTQESIKNKNEHGKNNSASGQ